MIYKKWTLSFEAFTKLLICFHSCINYYSFLGAIFCNIQCLYFKY